MIAMNKSWLNNNSFRYLQPSNLKAAEGCIYFSVIIVYTVKSAERKVKNVNDSDIN